MNKTILRASTAAFAAALGFSVGCGSSSSCGGSNINAAAASAPATMQCGRGTYLNAQNQCVPQPPVSK